MTLDIVATNTMWKDIIMMESLSMISWSNFVGDGPSNLEPMD